MMPQLLVDFQARLRERLPEAVFQEDPLVRGGGVTDVFWRGRHLYVVHIPNRYTIGLALTTEDSGYDSRPDEVHETVDAAVERAVALLNQA